MSAYLYENLPVNIRPDSTGSYYEVGVVIEDAFFAFGAYKAGGFDEDLAEARTAREQAQREQAQPAPAQ